MDTFIIRKCDFSLEFHKLRVLEDRGCKQKSKVQWFGEGDLNTVFFHRAALGRRRSNTISPIMLSLPENAIAKILRFAVTSSF